VVVVAMGNRIEQVIAEKLSAQQFSLTSEQRFFKVDVLLYENIARRGP